MKDRAARRVRLDPNAAAMRLDDGARNRQADAHALPLGGDKWLEQLLGDFRRDAGAGVGHADPHHDRRQPAATEMARSRGLRCFHRFHGVADQIEQHLLDLDFVGQHQRRCSDRTGSCTRMPRSLTPTSAKRARLLDQLGDAFDPALAFAARDEIAQAADDLAGAHRLVGGLVQRVAHHGRRVRRLSPSSSRREPLR